MAYRQYVGARYVPLFDGTWNSTKNYEPLTIVEDANGNSYTSKKDVPAGTPLSNREYWVQTSSFSGAIEQLRRDVTGLTDRVDDAETDIDGLTTGLADTNGKVDLLRNKKYFMITDSYGNRTDASGKTVAQILTARGYDIEGVAISGGGFTKTGTERFASHLSDYTGNKNLVTDVLFCGGANDNSKTVAEIMEAINETVVSARSLYPNAKIHIVHWGAVMNGATWALDVQTKTVDGYIKGAALNKCVYANNAEYILRNTQLLQDDLIHPNQSGVSNLANQLQMHLEGGTIDVYYEINVDLTLKAEGVTTFAAPTSKMTRHNGSVIWSAPSAAGIIENVIVTTPFMGQTGFNPLFEMSNTLIAYPQTAANRYVNMAGRVLYADDSKYVAGWMKFLIYSKEVRAFIVSSDYTNAKRYTGIDNTLYFND